MLLGRCNWRDKGVGWQRSSGDGGGGIAGEGEDGLVKPFDPGMLLK